MTVHETGKWGSTSATHPIDCPTPLIKPLPKATEVPIADLGPLAGPVIAIAELTQASPALALNAVLSSISVCVQGHANAETLSGDVPLSVFCLSIAGSGERKSTVDGYATKAIREFEKPRLRQFAIEAERFEAAQQTGRPRSGCTVIEDDFDDHSRVPSSPPVDPKIVFDDITFEGLSKHFENGRPSIGILCDEGGKIIEGYSMSAQNRVAFSAALSHLWDGKPINRTRAGTRSISLPGCRTAVHIGVQPSIIDGLLQDEKIRDQGLLARMLIVHPDSMKGQRRYSDDDATLLRRREAEKTLEAFNLRLTELLERDLPYVDCESLELAPRRLTLDATAHRLLANYYNIVEAQQIDGGRLADVTDFASKSAEQAARIAGILALFEDPDTNTINGEQMQTAITVAQFFLDEVVRIMGAGRVSSRVREAEMLRDWLVNHHEGDIANVRTCLRYGPNKIRTAPIARDRLKLLEEFGWITFLEGTYVIDGQNSNTAFRINRPSCS